MFKSVTDDFAKNLTKYQVQCVSHLGCCSCQKNCATYSISSVQGHNLQKSSYNLLENNQVKLSTVISSKLKSSIILILQHHHNYLIQKWLEYDKNHWKGITKHASIMKAQKPYELAFLLSHHWITNSIVENWV